MSTKKTTRTWRAVMSDDDMREMARRSNGGKLPRNWKKVAQGMIDAATGTIDMEVRTIDEVSRGLDEMNREADEDDARMINGAISEINNIVERKHKQDNEHAIAERDAFSALAKARRARCDELEGLLLEMHTAALRLMSRATRGSIAK